jgi:hypothetical protein
MTPIVLVPLKDGDNPPYAILNQADWDTLMDLYCSEIWNINSDGNVCLWASIAKRQVTVARLIMDAGPGEQIYHKNRNKLDLRKTNLVFHTSDRASRRERDFIKERQVDLSRTIHVWEYIVPKIGYNTLPQQTIKNYGTPYGVQSIY